MAVYRLPDDIVFPDPRDAEPDGLLAVGGDYSVERMLLAYNHGIFPWFQYRRDIYWYATNPRMVVFPEKYRPNHGLRRVLKNCPYRVTINTCFEDVISHCAKIKRKEKGTWINRSYKKSFIELHKLGYAVSVETWLGDELAGGLYGIVAGPGFTGESMFSIHPNASKVAFHQLVMLARHLKWKFIDAQQDTPHMQMLGGELIPFDVFYSMLTE
ncbi:Leucyl/phenylalanyl-tRNA--protein transferase [anaerobic digester metagenome]